MTYPDNPAKIIAFVGLAGSGKSSVVDYLTQKGYPKVYFGGVIYKAMREIGLEPGSDWEREAKFREEIREREGKDFVVKRIIDEIHHLINAGQRHIVADGLYSWTEYRALLHEFPGELTVVAIVAPKHIRHHRLSKRPIRPLTGEQANERDWAEIEHLEKGGPIAIADYYVHNDGSPEKLHQQVDVILAHTKFVD